MFASMMVIITGTAKTALTTDLQREHIRSQTARSRLCDTIQWMINAIRRWWRAIDRTSFYTDMDVHLLLDTPEKAFCWKGMLRCLCGFYPEFSCTIVGLSDKYDHEGLTRLTSYLVPVYSNSDVDHAAEQIWSWYGMKEALTDPEARNTKTLARRMGLTIQYLPVYEHDGIDSITRDTHHYHLRRLQGG